MTIGDEKVVALSERLRPDVECAPWVISEVRNMEFDYAELAAERDEMATKGRQLAELAESLAARMQAAESQLAEERELRMSLESSWQQAEAQLAELRGRVLAMREKWAANSGKHPGTIESIVMKAICTELSTLAAADGATTGEMK